MQVHGSPDIPLRDVVLVGGGHSHVQLLRMQRMAPLPGARVTVVVDRPVAVYSGMVPGFVAGQYTASELEIDVQPLARGAGVRCIVAPVTRIDPVARRIELLGRPPLRYDFASLNVGSTVRDLELPGVRARALSTRPIGVFVSALEDWLDRTGTGVVQVVVVGAGAGGVELAFCLRERLFALGARPLVTLLDAGDRIMPERSASLRRRIEAAAARRDITLRSRARVVEVGLGQVRLASGDRLPADLVVWVTGARAPELLQASPLPKDERGFVWVDDHLRVEGHPELFAVGDNAVLRSWPAIPKAGVYAVREGPVLAENLRASLLGQPTRAYSPQGDFLALLNLGDGTALGEKWGRAVEGRWVFELKDRIDREFMGRFQVLDEGGRPRPTFAEGLPPMAPMDPPCGGCAAKLGAELLHEALRGLAPGEDPEIPIGLSAGEDVAVVQRPGEVVVQSVDHFPAFTDDPWLVGRVAALNATSDLWAKGVSPRVALATVCLPEDLPGETQVRVLGELMGGARTALEAEGCSLVGGHTTLGPQLSVGFAVTGFASRVEALWRKGGALPGDALVLSRALGSGVILHADMGGQAPGPWVQGALQAMQRGNRDAAEQARALQIHAATDVTGFGLCAHLLELLGPRGRATLWLDRLPALAGALELLALGHRSSLHASNRQALARVDWTPELEAHPAFELLFDPQTGGGLLFALPADQAPDLVDALRRSGEAAAMTIGRIGPYREGGKSLDLAPGPSRR